MTTGGGGGGHGPAGTVFESGVRDGDGQSVVTYPLRPTATATTAVAGTYRAVAPTSLTLTATVKTTGGQTVPDGGTVVFTLNGQTFPAQTAGGGATLTLPGYKLASYGDGTQVRAAYQGAPGYAPSQGTGRLTVLRR